MKHSEKERAIAYIRLAIKLAKDGGKTPFTDEEYELMYRLLDEMSSADEETTSTNNDTVVVVSEDDVDDFFVDDYDDYKKIMGKCFINEEIGIAVKILEILEKIRIFVVFLFSRQFYNSIFSIFKWTYHAVIIPICKIISIFRCKLFPSN